MAVNSGNVGGDIASWFNCLLLGRRARCFLHLPASSSRIEFAWICTLDTDCRGVPSSYPSPSCHHLVCPCPCPFSFTASQAQPETEKIYSNMQMHIECHYLSRFANTKSQRFIIINIWYCIICGWCSYKYVTAEPSACVCVWWWFSLCALFIHNDCPCFACCCCYYSLSVSTICHSQPQIPPSSFIVIIMIHVNLHVRSRCISDACLHVAASMCGVYSSKFMKRVLNSTAPCSSDFLFQPFDFLFRCFGCCCLFSIFHIVMNGMSHSGEFLSNPAQGKTSTYSISKNAVRRLFLSLSCSISAPWCLEARVPPATRLCAHIKAYW